jgi:hypothetical protein
MKTFTCKFTSDGILEKSGAPNYIRCNPFDAVKMFSTFEVIGKPITKNMQIDWLDSCLNDDGGWVIFVCGPVTEQLKLFGYSLMMHYAKNGAHTNRLDWHHVTGSRWNKYLDSRDKILDPNMIVLDSLLTHPPMHPNGSRGYDPARIGKIYDIVAKYRGISSIVILCPDLLPEEAYHISMVQPDMFFSLRYNAKTVEF